MPDGREVTMTEKKISMKHLPLATKIFIALGLAIVAGLCFTSHAEIPQTYLRPIGTIFLNLLKFIVCPIVLFSMMCGITSMRDIRKVASIGWKTVLYFLCTTALAVVIGLLMGSLFSGLFPKIATAELSYEAETQFSLMDTLVGIFPSNFFAPLVEANMLQVIVMALLIGFAIVLIGGEKSDKAIRVINTVNDIFLKCMEMILRLTPIGVFCMLTPVIAESGPSVIGSLAAVLGVAYLAFVLQTVLVYGVSVSVLARISPLRFFRGMAPTMAFAFSSASSVGSISLNMKSCRELGADDEVASFVLPLGATINMGGTAIYMAVSSIFIASCYGIQMTLPQMLSIVATATVSAIGTAGVPGSGMVMLAMVLSSAGLPLEGIALVAGVDRIFDMGRTVVNVTGDSAAAVIVSRIERKSAERRRKKEAKKEAKSNE